jgi:predicted nucleic acid-binding protein
MILVDTSVLIDVIRTGDPKLTGLLRTHGGAVCGVVRAEVLHGACNPKDRVALLALLNLFAEVPAPESAWVPSGTTSAPFGPGA